MILGNLDEGLSQTDDKGVRLPVRPLVVVAENGLKPFGLDQIGKAVMSSTGTPLSMRIEAARRKCSLCARSVLAARRRRRVRPLVEQVRVSPHCEIGLGITPKALAEITPLEPLGWRLEGERGELDLRPDLDLVARFVPKMGYPAHHVARFRTQRPCLEPAKESLNDRVVYVLRRDVPSGAKVSEGCLAARQPLIVGDGLDQRRPIRVSHGGALPIGSMTPANLSARTESAEQVGPGFLAHSMRGRTDFCECRPDGRRPWRGT